MHNLSAPYQAIKQLRSGGNCAAAISALRGAPPASDDDAFEAVVCLFVCGDVESALNVCRTHSWKKEWARHISAALDERFRAGNASRAIALAKKSVSAPGVPHDAQAVYLLLLQDSGLVAEADAYIASRLQNPPLGETFLLTIMAEVAISAKDWRAAYKAASGVLARDPDDYRALLVMSTANYEIGNIHESLGNATRAAFIDKGSAPAVFRIMRCQNKLGDYYAALAAFRTLEENVGSIADIHVELGTAYYGLEDRSRAVAEYRAALAADPRSTAALRALVGIYISGDDAESLEALIESHGADLHDDIECVSSLGLQAFNRGDLDQAAALFRKTRSLAEASVDALNDLPWPIPEPRVRHDYEQLELLARRGRLNAAGRGAFDVLKRYHGRGGGVETTFAPAGAERDALENALCTTCYVPEVPFAGRALGGNDYGAIEDRYLTDRLVVIDEFLSSEALALLRQFCEEATVWKFNNARGYVGAILGQGFSPRVLLAAAHELRLAMPRVIGDQPLLQAWGFKYDQRMQGINMHADFAKVNVNFWITSDDACEDPATGGMVVYDVPVPKSWTFAEYNQNSEKLAAYLEVNRATAQRVPYRANRCVLFDSSLIHISDEMHFKPGYENRRVNVTLLYGKARTVE